MFMCNLGIDVTLFHIPCSPLSGVWHFGGGQREIPHRRLLCEPDITGAGFPQFCPVPALHREREEVSGARSPSVHPSSTPAAALDLRTWTCLGHTAAVHTGWSRAWLISSSIFTLTTNIHAHTHTHTNTGPVASNFSISTTSSRRCVFVGLFMPLLLLLF